MVGKKVNVLWAYALFLIAPVVGTVVAAVLLWVSAALFFHFFLTPIWTGEISFVALCALLGAIVGCAGGILFAIIVLDRASRVEPSAPTVAKPRRRKRGQGRERPLLSA
jgi:ABC-type antimicrobial peptide transport system permease subunit